MVLGQSGLVMGAVVLIRQFLVDRSRFDPEALKSMSKALAGASRALGTREKDKETRWLLAAAIIDLALAGETDPERLKAAALKRVRN